MCTDNGNLDGNASENDVIIERTTCTDRSLVLDPSEEMEHSVWTSQAYGALDEAVCESKLFTCFSKCFTICIQIRTLYKIYKFNYYTQMRRV